MRTGTVIKWREKTTRDKSGAVISRSKELVKFRPQTLPARLLGYLKKLRPTLLSDRPPNHRHTSKTKERSVKFVVYFKNHVPYVVIVPPGRSVPAEQMALAMAYEGAGLTGIAVTGFLSMEAWQAPVKSARDNLLSGSDVAYVCHKDDAEAQRELAALEREYQLKGRGWIHEPRLVGC